jgi:hypothetical protein
MSIQSDLINPIIIGIAIAFFTSVLAFETHRLLEYRQHLKKLVDEIEKNVQLLQVSEDEIRKTIYRKSRANEWAGLDNKKRDVITGYAEYFSNKSYRNFKSRNLYTFIEDANYIHISDFYLKLASLNTIIRALEFSYNREKNISLDQLIFDLTNLLKTNNDSVNESYNNIPISAFKAVLSQFVFVWLYNEILGLYFYATIIISYVVTVLIVLMLLPILNIEIMPAFGFIILIFTSIFSCYVISNFKD